MFIIKALQNGADGVLVSGCHPGDCHYISGNLAARRKFALVKELVQYAGIEPQRVQFTWVSASEGGRFASIIDKVVEEVRKVGPNRVLVSANAEVQTIFFRLAGISSLTMRVEGQAYPAFGINREGQ